MIAGSILFGLVAMVAYGLANVYSLPLANRFGSARFLLLRGVVVCGLLTVVALPTLGRLADWRAALAALAIGALGYLPPLAFTHGIKISRVSIVAPIAGTAPLITVILSAAILSARLHSLQWLGIVLIVVANIAISLNFRSLRDSNILKLASGVPYALTAAVLWGLVFFLIIYPTRSLGPWMAAWLLEIGVMASAAVHVWLRRKPLQLRQIAGRPMVANAALIAAGTLAYTVGVHSFNIGLVATLSNSTAIVSILAAAIVHHEQLTRHERLLAVLMIGGVVLISLA